MFPLPTPTKGLKRLHQLDGELLPFGQLLQHLGDLIVSTPNQAMAVDRLDHISHVDNLDLMDDAPFSDSLKTAKLKLIIQSAIQLISQIFPNIVQGFAFSCGSMNQKKSIFLAI